MPPNRSSFPPSRQSVLHPLRKKQKQEPSLRFLPCPVCRRSFPSYFIHDHVNICLDSPTAGRAPSSHLISNDYDRFSVSRGLLSNGGDVEEDANPRDLKCPPTEKNCTKPLLASSSSATALPSNWSPREDSAVPVLSSVSEESAGGRDRDGVARMPEDEACGFYQKTQDSSACDFIQSPKATERTVPEVLLEGNLNSPQIGREAQNAMTLPGEDSFGKQGLGLQISQVQRQSQAKLSMLCKFSMSAALKRKPTVTVLQSGMVLLRSWLSLDIQQRLVNESQSAAHLFKRPSTAGGGKYHLYSMAFGCQWDSKTRRYAAQDRGHQIPVWMYHLAKQLASDAHDHTHVYAPGSDFAPDVALVNFYPVKDEELGVVGLGGHQDLDDSCDMPVVSASVGDSMTFFYRRLPPQSRRKSGIQIIVDESAARVCKDGDTAHNSEKKIILESGDVLVFGGESRLVYHGTRFVQPGTRPPGLHMVPGRLNFTFRQCNNVRSS